MLRGGSQLHPMTEADAGHANRLEPCFCEGLCFLALQGLTRLGANDCGRLVRGNGQSNLAALSQLRRLDCLGDLPGSGGKSCFLPTLMRGFIF